MEQLGQIILQKTLNDERDLLSISNVGSDQSSGGQDDLYLHSLELSLFLKENNIKFGGEKNKLDFAKRIKLRELVKQVIDDLNSAGQGPNYEVEAGPKVLQAYKVSSYALLSLVESSDETDTDSSSSGKRIAQLKRKIKEVKAKNIELQINYDQLLSSSEVGTASSHLKPSSSPTSSSSNISTLEREIQSLRDMKRSADKLLDVVKDNLALPPSITLEDAAEITKNAIFDLQKEACGIARHSSTDETDNTTSTYECDGGLNYGSKKESGGFTSGFAESGGKRSFLERENRSLRDQLSKLQQEKESIEAELRTRIRLSDDLSTQLESSRREYNQRSVAHDSSDARLVILDTELQASKMVAKGLEEKVARQKEKIGALKLQNMELTNSNKEKDFQYENTKMKYEKLLSENDDLKATIKNMPSKNSLASELKAKDDELKKLHSALMDLADQLELTTSDLSSENKVKNHVICLLQRQDGLLQESEKSIKESQRSYEELSSRMQQLQEKYNQLNKKVEELNCDHEEVSSSLYKHIKLTYPSCNMTDQLLLILDSDGPVTQRIIDSFEALHKCTSASLDKNPNSNTIEELEEKSRRLLLYFSNLIHFMYQIANSNDIQEWLLDSSQTHDFRPRLIAAAARVEAFLRQNNLEPEGEDLVSSYAFLPTYLKPRLESSGAFNRSEYTEELAVIEQFALANVILTKFSEELQRNGQILMQDMRQMKQELNKADLEAGDLLDQETLRLKSDLSNANHRITCLNNKLSQIQANLRKLTRGESTDNDKDILDCLTLIVANDDDFEHLDNEEEEMNQEQYIAALETKLKKTIDEMRSAETEYNETIDELTQRGLDLKRKLYNVESSMKEQNTELQNQVTSQRQQITQLEFDKASLMQHFNVISEENKELQKTIEQQSECISDFPRKLEIEIQQVKREFSDREEEMTQRYTTLLDDLNQKLEGKVMECDDRIRDIKNQMKEEIRKKNYEVEYQTNRNTELRKHYEKIQDELREKASDARQAEAEAKDEVTKLSNESSELKSVISSLRVDNKMLQMKLNSMEDKTKREKELVENQTKMILLSKETEHQAKLDEAKSVWASHMHNFLVLICEKFKDYVDFNKPISEESVAGLLDCVLQDITSVQNKVIELKKNGYDINEIRSILGISGDASVTEAVTDAVIKSREYDRSKQFLEQKEQEYAVSISQSKALAMANSNSKEWADWGRRLHSIITDSFSGKHTDKELRFVLEEAIMSSIGQRRVWRHMEILRTEKQMFLRGLIKPLPFKSIPIPTVRILIVAFASINRLQRLSGNLHATIAIPKSNVSFELPRKHSSHKNAFQELNKNTAQSGRSKKHYPIVSLM